MLRVALCCSLSAVSSSSSVSLAGDFSGVAGGSSAVAAGISGSAASALVELALESSDSSGWVSSLLVAEAPNAVVLSLSVSESLTSPPQPAATTTAHAKIASPRLSLEVIAVLSLASAVSKMTLNDQAFMTTAII